MVQRTDDHWPDRPLDSAILGCLVVTIGAVVASVVFAIQWLLAIAVGATAFAMFGVPYLMVPDEEV